MARDTGIRGKQSGASRSSELLEVYTVPGDEISRNKVRAALEWMDEFAPLVELTKKNDLPVGDLSHMREVRERLQCKPFSWYLDNIYPDMYRPPMKGAKTGAIVDKGGRCFDLLGHQAGGIFGPYPCHWLGGSQAMFFLIFFSNAWLIFGKL